VSLVPEVSVVVELRVAVEPGVDPVALERAIAEQGRRGRYERKLWMRDLVMGVAYPPVDR
jgi:hypothetical protein